MSEKCNLHENITSGRHVEPDCLFYDAAELPASSYTKGQSFRAGGSQTQAGKLESRGAGSAGQRRGGRRPAGSAEILARRSCQTRALPSKAGPRRAPSSHSGFGLAATGLRERSRPALLRTRPRPPRASAAAGRWRAAGGEGWPSPVRSLPRPDGRSRRSRGAAASSSRGLGSDVGGRRLPPRRFQTFGQMLFLFRRLRPRPPPAKPDGRPAALQSPSAGLRRGGGSGAGPEAQSPPLRPAPSVGLAPEGGSGEGRWGPHPQSLPFLRPAQTRSPGAVPALAPSSPPRQTRPAEAKPLEKSPALRGLPPDPRPRAAANGCPLLRMRRGERGACVLNGT